MNGKKEAALARGPTGQGRKSASRIEHPLTANLGRDTLVTALMAVATAALFVLMANSAAHARIQRIDDSFLRYMISIRAVPLTVTAKVLNVLGLVYVTLPVRVLIGGFLAWRRRWWHFAAFASAIVLSEVLIGPVKALYSRVRPPGSLVHTSGASFPSGHAVAATVTLIAAVIALFPEGRKRSAWGAAGAIFSLAMGVSRAYLAAHWLSDAVAGVLLGTSTALVALMAVDAIRRRTHANRRAFDRDRPPTIASSSS